ncbi:MAG: HyaD/HybD family hydrogenase maturation endopeptidase [Gemmatimonadales bacterium]
MTEPGRRILVIGLGNPLMADDGAGLAALDLLARTWQLPDSVELLDGGTWGMNLLPTIEAADTVLLLDAIHTGGPPGAPVELEGPEIPAILRHKLSPHQIDLGEVLALAALRGTLPERLVAIGVEPAELTMRTALSAPVAAALPGMVARAVARLQGYGVPAIPAEPAACTS